MIIGLTGGIGMGKSTAAKILAEFGLPIYSADKAVHDLLKKNGKGVKPVAKQFPAALINHSIDRETLGQIVFGKEAELKKLEKILHPLVQEVEAAFVKKAKNTKRKAVVLEIPLLFETRADKRCDVVLCVTAPKDVQKARVLSRKGMTSAKFKAILARQMPDEQRCKKADYVVRTGVGVEDTRKQLRAILMKSGI